MEELISEKQIVANRENAQLGGVKTEAGKAVSKYNALKHGFFSKQTLLRNESIEELEELGKGIRESLKPETEMETLMVEQIISSTWRLQRAFKVEAQMIDPEDDPTSEYAALAGEKRTLGLTFARDFSSCNTFGLLTRYIASIERSLYKALHELQRFQAQRKGQEVPVPSVLDVHIDKNDD